MVRDIASSTAAEERVALARLPGPLTASFPADAARQVSIPCGAHVCFDLPERPDRLRAVCLHLRFVEAGRPATLSLWDAGRRLAVDAPNWERPPGAAVRRQMWLRFPVPESAHPLRPPLRIYLPYDTPVELLELRLEAGAADGEAPLRPVRVPPRGKRWIAYGDSITLGRQASEPGLTYPAVAARALGVECWNLGFGGAARAEPPVAIALASLPCDVMSLAIGTNVYTPGWYDAPAWAAAYRNALELIRARRPDLPLVVVSPVVFPGTGEAPERTPNARGLSMAAIRRAVEEEARSRLAAGDRRLRLVRGLEVIGPDRMDLMGDHAHPNDAGYAALAAAVAAAIRSLLEDRP
jgi:lysophospholipase L1-like esterase